MRIFLIAILCTSSVCLAQESCHNDEFGFTINIPSKWYASLEEEWPDKLKNALELLYFTKKPLLLMLNPLGTEIGKAPCIHVEGIKLKRTTTSEAIAILERTGREKITNEARAWAEILLRKKFNQYREVDTSYDYNSSGKLGIAKILYEHKINETYFLSAIATFVGRQRRVDFSGYLKGDNPEEFWQVFTEVIDSFEFDPDAAPKGGLGKITEEIKGVGGLSKEQKFNRILKWGSIILTISIILVFVKMLLGRYF